MHAAARAVASCKKKRSLRVRYPGRVVDASPHALNDALRKRWLSVPVRHWPCAVDATKDHPTPAATDELVCTVRTRQCLPFIAPGIFLPGVCVFPKSIVAPDTSTAARICCAAQDGRPPDPVILTLQ